MGTDFISQVPFEWYWLFLFVSVFTENIFPPYPGDTVVVFAGYLAGAGNLKISSLIIAIVTGNLASAAIMYYFGLEIMEFMFNRLKSENLKKVFSRESLEKTHVWFERYGFWAVVFSRFSAGIRFFVAIIAGMVRMHISIFLLAFLLATIIWNSILVYGGYTLGKNWSQLLHYIRLYSGIIGVVLVIGAAFFVLRSFLKKRPKSSK